MRRALRASARHALSSPGPSTETGEPPARPGVRLAILGLIAVVALCNIERTPLEYNWDLLPYIAIAKSYDLSSLVEIHRETYRLAEQRIPPESYRPLIMGDPPYRATLARDPEAFAQALPFYRVKPLFPFLLHLLDRAGVDPILAGVWLSRVAYFAMALLLAWWYLRRLPAGLTALSLPILLSSGFVAGMAGWFTPDALSTLAMLAATILILERRERIGWPLMALAVAVRPDNVIFLALFGLWALLHHMPSPRWIVTAMVGGGTLQLLQNQVSGNYGWKVLFHHSMVQRLIRPADFTPLLEPQRYLDIYLRQLRPGVISEAFMLSLLVGIVAAVLHRRQSSAEAPWTGILSVTPVYMVIHWLLHPVDKDRTLAFGYLIVVCGLLFLVARREPAQRPRTHAFDGAVN